MSWNHRVVKHDEGSGWYGIHEVYYDDDGKPEMCSVEPMAPVGEDLDELKQDIEWMLDALEKPVLSFKVFSDTHQNENKDDA